MKITTIKTIKKYFAIVILALFATVANAGAVEIFWLEHTISGKQYGPIRNEPGFRIRIGDEIITIMESAPGKIRFASSVNTSGYGPYKLENSRIVKLGNSAFSIVNTDSVTKDSAQISAEPVTARDYAIQARSSAASNIPAKGKNEPKLIDSRITNSLMGRVWIEPFHSTKYDWKLGGFSGTTEGDIERMEFGLSIDWKGFFASAGFSSGSKLSGDIVPTGVSVSKITLEEGSGLHIAGGYTHSIILDPHWRALVTAAVTYRDEDFDLAVSSLHIVEKSPEEESLEADTDETKTESSVKSYEYVDSTAGTSVSDLAVLAAAGIEFDGAIWGARAEIAFELFSDIKAEGNAFIADTEYAIEAEHSHPVTLTASLWCYIIDDIRAEAAASFGGDTALRLSLGFIW